MKRILVVGGHSSNNDDIEELRAFGAGISKSAQAVICDMTPVDQLYFVIAPGEFRAYNSQDRSLVSDYSVVILRNKMRTYNNIAYLLSRYCSTSNVPFFNDYSRYFPATKAAQAVIFYEQEVPFIKTVYAMDHAVLKAAIQKELELPYILKDAQGSKGVSNYLVRSLEELDQILANEPETDFLAQTYLPNNCDYRILLLGDQTMVIERQGTDDSHLNNTSTGGKGTLVPLDNFPSDIVMLSRRLARAMDLTIAGVDVVPHKDTGEFYVLETNAQPQIFTGTFLEEKQQAMTALLKSL